MLRDILRILTTNLAVNLSTLIIISIAPYFLSVESFSNFVLVIAVTTYGSMVLDFGLNIGVVKKYSENKDEKFLSLLISGKAALLLFALPVIPLMFLDADLAFWAVAILCAAALNFWSGLRAYEQAHQDYRAYSRANMMFAGSRLVFGLAGIATGSWLLTALALFVGPVLFVLILERKRIYAAFSWPSKDIFASLFGYSMFLHLDTIFYGAAMYIPQVFISNRLGPIEVGSFGLIMAFLAPLSLINNTLRVYILPRICSGDITSRDMIKNPKVIFGLVGFLLLVFISAVIASFVLDFLYGARYPQLAGLFVVTMMLSVLSMVVGLFNIEVHRLGGIKIYALIHGISFLFLLLFLYLFGYSFISIVWISAIMILLGELAEVVFIHSSSILKNKEKGDKITR